MASSRRDVTTEHLRTVAVELLLANGAHAFSLNAVSHTAYVSIGAVYERWENKAQAFADLLEHIVRPAVTELLDSISGLALAEQQKILFTDDTAVRTEQLLVEMLFAAREDDHIKPGVAALVREIQSELQRSLGDSKVADSLAAWQLATLLGNALLLLGRAGVCDLSAEVASALDHAIRYDHGDAVVAIHADLPNVVPKIPPPAELDFTGERILDATRTVLAASHDAATREVALNAGVTTGALYRRFGSKSELINDVLLVELNNDRYSWTKELIEAWHAAPDSDSLADVVSTKLNASLANMAQVNMLLQITSQARSDETVRSMVVNQIESVVRSREQMFAALIATGVLAPFATASAQAWLFQATPIGARLLVVNGCGPTPEQITLAIRAIAASYTAGDEN